MDVRKNASEVVRIEREPYRGVDLVHARVWYDDGTGNYLPSRKGLSLRPDSWPEVIAALEEALSGEAEKV